MAPAESARLSTAARGQSEQLASQTARVFRQSIRRGRQLLGAALVKHRQAAHPGDADAMVGQMFDSLLGGGALARSAWLALAKRIKLQWPELAEALVANVDTAAEEVLLPLLQLVMRGGFRDFDSQSRLFDLAESVGLHILRPHFYSPVPTLRELDGRVWTPYDLTGVDWRPAAQRRLLARLGTWAEELGEFPDNQPASNTRFFYNNTAFCRTDAAVYYALIRELKPRRVLEVGAGYSTLLAAEAAARNASTIVDCIEPFPMAALREKIAGFGHLIEQKVQAVPVEEFERLEAGDILFIDSSHVSRVGSDVNYLILRVLPRLGDGVLVHIHDMFLPDEYPETWVRELKLFWNEQYLVYVFLLFNSRFRVLLSTHFLGRAAPEDIVKAFPFCQPPGGGSLWLMTGSADVEEVTLNANGTQQALPLASGSAAA